MSFIQIRSWAKSAGERIVYRIGGLPIAVAALMSVSSRSSDGLRTAYAHQYWQLDNLQEIFEFIAACLVWPVGLIAAALWFTWRNGSIARAQSGKSSLRQFVEQLRVYLSTGILPPWYYAFELHDRHSRPGAFLSRFETKRGLYMILKLRRHTHSKLGDKLAFARRCMDQGIPTVPVLATAAAGEILVHCGTHLPRQDLFIKPIRGRGGRGAERWDYVGGDRYAGPNSIILSESELLEKLREESHLKPRIVQPRMLNCDSLCDLNNGALSTVRALSCLDEHDRPQVIAAVLRMAIGDNHRVDNFHAGGIAAAIDVRTGELGPASNLGIDSRMGWVDHHPGSSGRIRGRRLPYWQETCRLAERAHRAFCDRVVIGWDIAITNDGPIVVEGNGGPDLDIMQRAARSGLAEGRLGELLFYHLTHDASEAGGVS